MNTTTSIPVIPQEVISWLNSRFPLTLFMSCKSLEDVYKMQGVRQVVDLLQKTHDDQQKNILRL